MKYEIYRGEEILASVRLTGNWSSKVMGEDIAQSSWEMPSFMEFQKGDYILKNGFKYVLSGRPGSKEASTLSYEYTGTFEAYNPYSLIDTQYFMYDQDNALTVSSFSLTGKPVTFLELLIKNANRRSSGWSLGVIDDAEAATLSFSDDDNCRTVLTKLAEQFKTEFWIDGKVIHLTKKGSVTGLNFAYGHGKGLYEVNALTPDDFQLITKLYYFGGERNLPVGYRKNSAGVASRKLLGAARFIQADAGSIKKYGVIERSKTFSDIFPQRTGVISALGNKPTIVIDSSLNFDITAQLQPGITGKISFTTGKLAGYEFEINNYQAATKAIEFNVDKNETAFGAEGLPNQFLKPAVGDKYVLFDIQMPAAYVAEAEAKLDAKALELLNNSKQKPLRCEVVCSPAYIEQNNLYNIKIGDYCTITSPVMNGAVNIRIVGVKVDLQDPRMITLELADEVTISSIIRSIIEKDTIRNIVSLNKLYDVNRARRNAKTVSELQNYVIDPEGNYFPEKIRAGSIESLSLAVGAKSTNFSLKEVRFDANAGGDPSVFKVSAGQLVHFTLDIPGVGFTWNMAAKDFTGLIANKTYYVYARVSRTSLSGTWVIAENIITAEQENGFFNLQSGVLFAVSEGRRDHEFTKGMTFIIGDQITAGVLKDLSGLNFFDMTQGKANFGDDKSGWDWNVTYPGQFNVRGGIVSRKLTVGYGDYFSGIGDEGEFPLFIGAPAMNKPEKATFRVSRDGTLYATAANISGILNAGPGSTIGNILINAEGKINLVGSKVEIKPDDAVTVFNGGTADFSRASRMLVPSNDAKSWKIYISTSNVGGGAVPPAGGASSLSGLTDVNLSSLISNGQALVYSGGKWVNQNVITDLSNYFNRTQVNDLFGGVSAVTGYNKTNWDTAFGWGNHNGLYKLASYVPTWNEVSGKPSAFSPAAHTHLWADITNRPGSLSAFTNDLGNYGNWITSAQGAAVFQPLENQRLSKGNAVEFSEITAKTKLVIPSADAKSWKIYISTSNIGGGAVPPTGGASSLSGLTDVLLSGMSNGQALIYNTASSKWINQSVVTDLSNETLNTVLSRGASSNKTITLNGANTVFYNDSTNVIASRGDTRLSGDGNGYFHQYVQRYSDAAPMRWGEAWWDGGKYHFAQAQTDGFYFGSNITAPNFIGNLTGSASALNGTAILSNNNNFNSAPFSFVGKNSGTDNNLYTYSATGARLALGIPAGGETLQSITARGNQTGNTIFTTGNNRPIGNPSGRGLYFQQDPAGDAIVESYNYASGSGNRLLINPNGGNVNFGGSIQLQSVQNISWNAAYSSGGPTITGSAQALFFYPNGSISGETMRISNTGNVGIMTQTPGTTLDVNGSGRFLNNLFINGVSGTNRGLTYSTTGSNRWAAYADDSAETGTNVGTNFNIAAYSDTGAFLYNPVSINRSTGLVNFNRGFITRNPIDNNAVRMYGTAPFISWYDNSNATRWGYIQHNGSNLVVFSDIGSVVINSGLNVNNNVSVGGNLGVSGLLSGSRISSGYDSGQAGSVNASNWFRSSGATGWINQTYSGGIWMTDSTWVRVYNGKGFLAENTIQGSDFTATTSGYKSLSLHGMRGDYDTNGTTDKIIWTIGDAWNTISSHYGLGYSYNSGLRTTAHQVVLRLSGATNISLGMDGTAMFRGSVYTSNLFQSGTGTNGGFQNAGYNAGHNNIWRLGTAPEYGLGYYQATAEGDYIGFHLGNRNTPQFKLNQSGTASFSGGLTTPVIKATSALYLPSTSGKQWKIYVKDN